MWINGEKGGEEKGKEGVEKGKERKGNREKIEKAKKVKEKER